MDAMLWSLIGTLIVLIFLLVGKIYLLKKSAKEIQKAFAKRLHTETNTLIDISSRDRSMQSLAESINEQLRTLRSKRHLYKQGDLAVKETIANISHDLRTPLTAICGYLDLLEEEEKTETAAQYLAIIKSRVKTLTQLTDELFCYTLTASSPMSAPLEDVSLNHALEESVLAHYAVLKGCRITPEISMPEEKIIRTLHKASLLRIFENILSNAIKYSAGDLQITLTKQGEIVFSNHAPGLYEVDVQRLFDRLYTVETGKKSTGIGLAIAKSLTEQMHGRIAAQYADGVLSISISFP